MQQLITKFSKMIFAIVLFVVAKSTQAQTISLQLTPSNFNGYNISCFGLSDGGIDLIVTGGTSPYTYEWSYDAQANNEDLVNIPANYYHIIVTDANGETAEGEITLTQPEALRIELNPYRYPNGYNLSQNGACNGNVAATVTGGITSYTYLWQPGQQTISNPTNLCAGEAVVEVIDANGCRARERTTLSQPEKDSWIKQGNAGSNPQSDFIGTSDNQDFVLKTNNTEKLRIKSNGDLKASSLTGNDFDLLVADQNGVIQKLATVPNNAAPIPWYTTGNTFSLLSQPGFIGPTNNFDFVIKTGNQATGTLA
jgi:hypothetical protein